MYTYLLYSFLSENISKLSTNRTQTVIDTSIIQPANVLFTVSPFKLNKKKKKNLSYKCLVESTKLEWMTEKFQIRSEK